MPWNLLDFSIPWISARTKLPSRTSGQKKLSTEGWLPGFAYGDFCFLAVQKDLLGSFRDYIF